MAITQNQLTNIIGWIDFKMTYIYNMRKIALDPNSTQTQINQANANALTAVDDIQILLNTLYSYLGKTQQTGVYTLTQLQNMGLF